MGSKPVGPPPEVLAAFGLSDGTLAKVEGGQGYTFCIGHTILKPVACKEEAIWCARTFNQIRQDGFRVPQPLPAQDGRWVVQGWAAWERLTGIHDVRNQWHQMLDACDAFHAALADTPKPSFIAEQTHCWALADRFVWGEEELSLPDQVKTVVSRVQHLLCPVENVPCQVIHGDLGGNILYEPGLPPGIIDFSPYWRPTGYAKAIAVIDAVAWNRADVALLRCMDKVDMGYSFLSRAVVFRLAAIATHPNNSSQILDELRAYRPVIQYILCRAE